MLQTRFEREELCSNRGSVLPQIGHFLPESRHILILLAANCGAGVAVAELKAPRPGDMCLRVRRSSSEVPDGEPSLPGGFAR